MNINKILEKDFHILTKEDIQQIDAALKKRFFVEYERNDRKDWLWIRLIVRPFVKVDKSS